MLSETIFSVNRQTEYQNLEFSKSLFFQGIPVVLIIEALITNELVEEASKYFKFFDSRELLLLINNLLVLTSLVGPNHKVPDNGKVQMFIEPLVPRSKLQCFG